MILMSRIVVPDVPLKVYFFFYIFISFCKCCNSFATAQHPQEKEFAADLLQNIIRLCLFSFRNTVQLLPQNKQRCHIVTADQASRQLHTASGLEAYRKGSASGLEAYRKGSAVHLLIYLGCISGTSDNLKSINLSVHKVIMPVWM